MKRATDLTKDGVSAFEVPTDATIVTSDVTTNNASTIKHGFMPKLSNVATEYANGVGGYSTPPDTTYTSSNFTHDNLSGVSANEHLDWTASVGTIHADNYTDTIYSHPTGDGNSHVPVTSTTNEGRILQAGATAGSFSWSATDYREGTNFVHKDDNAVPKSYIELNITGGTPPVAPWGIKFRGDDIAGTPDQLYGWLICNPISTAVGDTHGSFNFYTNGQTSAIIYHDKIKIDHPLELGNYATGSLPSATTYDQTVVYDDTLDKPVYAKNGVWNEFTAEVKPFDLTFAMPTGANFTMPIHLNASFGYTITGATAITTAGTITLAVKIGTTAVTGLSAVSMSSTESTPTATAANVVAVGNDVNLTFSSNSAATYASVTVHCVRA